MTLLTVNIRNCNQSIRSLALALGKQSANGIDNILMKQLMIVLFLFLKLNHKHSSCQFIDE